MTKPIRVLVVDDSAVVRQLVTGVLSQERDMTVVAAADPLIAMAQMKVARPDVILLDLEMPRMDGLTFLRQVMAKDPIPVVICSGVAGSGTRIALRAIEEGAVAVVAKPMLRAQDPLGEFAMMLVDSVRGAAQARPRARASAPRPLAHPAMAEAVLRPRPSPAPVARPALVAVGASTGGPEALGDILGAMPPDMPGIVAVQHMPEVFTKAFADRLNEICRIEVREAVDGDRIREGLCLIAPGNRHTLVHRRGGHHLVEVVDGPLVSRHRPSVDVLFRSVARAAGASTVAVILTGMGDDGAEGMLELKKTGASTIAQDEATSVVFGMPREAIARGAVDAVVPLPAIASAILERVRRPSADPGRPRLDPSPFRS